ncbi:MAG: hypothetical protein L6Q97_04545 [Thermoanaerobaculia bacterium]|nr:hypothetical protein [Thermoanaerobaculia bacterium]
MMKPLSPKAAQDYIPLPPRKKLLDKWPESPDEIQRGMGKGRLPGASPGIAWRQLKLPELL